MSSRLVANHRCKMGVDWPTRLLGFVTLVHLPFSARSLHHFCHFTCVHEGRFMFWNKEEFQIELSRKIALWQIFKGHRSAWFPLLSACRLVDFDTSANYLPCVYVLLRLISIARYAFKSPRICFRGKNMKFTVNMLLTCILYCAPGPAAIRTVGRFLPRMSYITDVIFLFSYIFLGRCRSFTLRKLYVYLETFLGFLQLSDRAYASLAPCIGLFLLWSFWHHMIEM